MGIEIERKFLVDPASLGELANGQAISQGYIETSTHTTVRVRIAGEQAFLTIKGKTKGATRSEFEYSIPPEDAEAMLAELCSAHVIVKTRYCLTYADHLWEVDVFHGDNAGLIVAEVELEDENQTISLPPWVTQEVTGDTRYYNANLLHCPYSSWAEARF